MASVHFVLLIYMAGYSSLTLISLALFTNNKVVFLNFLFFYFCSHTYIKHFVNLCGT